MSFSTENSMNGLDVMSIQQVQNKKRRRSENAKRYKQTLKGRLAVQRGIVRAKARYATDPEFRARVLSSNRKRPRQKKDWITIGIELFRQMLQSHGSPIYIFCRSEKIILVPENLGDQKAWRKWVVDGQRIDRTFDAMYQHMPKAFVGTYDANIDTRELRQDIHCFLARSTSVVRKSIANEIPLPTLNKNIPCNDCENEKPCHLLELTCPSYRKWVGDERHTLPKRHLKLPRIPDKHLDGSIPAPGVI